MNIIPDNLNPENRIGEVVKVRFTHPFLIGLLAMVLVVQSTNLTLHALPIAPIQAEQDDTVAPKKSESFSEPIEQPPAWVTKGSYFDEGSGSEFVVVHSDELLKQREAQAELAERLVQTVHSKIDDLFGEGVGKSVGVDLDYIRKNMLQIQEKCKSNGVYTQQRSWPVSDENIDKLASPVRDAFKCYACVRFDSEFQDWARAEWQNRMVASRTMQVGLIALSAMIILALLFGYFTAEHKTRGFYSRRLQTAGVGILLFSIAILWWLSTQFTWL